MLGGNPVSRDLSAVGEPLPQEIHVLVSSAYSHLIQGYGSESWCEVAVGHNGRTANLRIRTVMV